MWRWYPAFVKALIARRQQQSLNVQRWESFPACDAKSVAIVGNAGYVGEIPQGPLIDSHDLVIRMNNFRISGFEAQVGRRVDVFFTNFFTDIRFERPEVREAKYVVASVPNNFRKYRHRQIHHRHAEHIVAGLKAMRRNDVYVPEWDALSAWVQQWGCFPSTGMMAALFALRYLGGARLYFTGFSFFQGGAHYFHDQPASARNHNFVQERKCLQMLLAPHVASGRIVIDPIMQDLLQLTPGIV